MNEASQVLEAPATAAEVATSEAAASEPKVQKQKPLPLPPIRVGMGEVPRDGVVTVTLFDIDPLWIANYRTEIETEYLIDKRNSIEEQGQLQPFGGVWSKDGKRIHLAFGFCRLECRFQLALKKLVKEFNDFFGREKGDEGFIDLNGLSYQKHKIGAGDTEREVVRVVNDSLDTITRMKHREQIKQAGAEWAEKYDNALKMAEAQVRTIEVGDPETDEAKLAARMASFTENKLRTNPPLWDELVLVDSMLSNGKKAKEIAEQLGKSEPVISKYRKVFNFPEHVRTAWTPEVLKEQFKLEDQAAINLKVAIRDTCISEFTHRLRLSETHDEALGISHCREFVDEVQHTKEPLRIREAFGLLQELTDVGEDGKPHHGRAIELGILRSKMRDARKAMKLPDPVPGAIIPAATATEAGVPATDPTTVDQLAELQKHAESTIATSAAATAATAPATVTPSKPEVVRSEDAATQAAIAAANAGGVSDSTASEPSLDDMNPDDAELERLIAEEAAAGGDLAAAAAGATPPTGGAAPAKAPDGQMRAKTTEAVTSKYRPRNPESLEKQAWQRLKDVASPTANPFDVVNNLSVVTELFSAIGMDKESTEVNRSFVKYEEEARVYFAKLEEVLSKHANEEERQAIQSLRPKYVAPGSTAANEAKAA